MDLFNRITLKLNGMSNATKFALALAVILVIVIILSVLSDDGSARECIRPSNTTGYNNITETNLSMGSEFDVSVGCSSGSPGTPSATACSVAGQAYTLSGCSVAQSDCIPPDPVTEGYDLSNVTGSLSKAGFSITGVECATDYGGTASATACSSVGQSYTLSGCSADGDDADVGSTNPCSLADVTAPTDGGLGTICADTSGSLAHGASCDMTCNNGPDPTIQPLCTNGALSSTTATCTLSTPGQLLSDTTTFTWVSGEMGANCDETCLAADSTCVGDGDWGIHDVSSFNEMIQAAGVEACDTLITDAGAADAGAADADSYYPVHITLNGDHSCYIPAQGIGSSCSLRGVGNRFCPCTV